MGGESSTVLRSVGAISKLVAGDHSQDELFWADRPFWRGLSGQSYGRHTSEKRHVRTRRMRVGNHKDRMNSVPSQVPKLGKLGKLEKLEKPEELRSRSQRLFTFDPR
jgi:hypothetical protein